MAIVIYPYGLIGAKRAMDARSGDRVIPFPFPHRLTWGGRPMMTYEIVEISLVAVGMLHISVRRPGRDTDNARFGWNVPTNGMIHYFIHEDST